MTNFLPDPRTADVITGANDLELLFTFKDFPIFVGCVDSDDKSADDFLDLNIYISKSSGMIQISPILPTEVVYKKSHGSGEVGKTWKLHHHEFAGFIHSFNPISVFEIGGAAGLLSDIYTTLYGNIPWTILDPIPKVNSPLIKTIIGSFNGRFSSSGIETIIHSHVFEHVFYPDKFVQDLSACLMPGKKMVFSVPNLLKMLENNHANCINFEHSIFLTEPYIEHLLSKHGFRIIKKQFFLDHSIFYAVVRDSEVQLLPLSGDLYEKNKMLFLDYINNLIKKVEQLNSVLSNTDYTVYQFGAHVFSQVMINLGLEADKISSIIDNDINKQGKRLYGTLLMVSSSESLSSVNHIMVIVNAGYYSAEIKENLNDINSNIIFLES